MNYRIIYKDELYHHGVKGMKWGVRRFQNPDGTRVGSTNTRKDGQVGPGVKLVAKSFKINEKTERAKASVASKFGMNKSAQTHRNNADYYKKTSEDLASGKVGKPKTNYQKAMRWLGKTEFATHAIKNSSDLSPQMKAQALAEQRLMRSADDWYKKRAKRYAAIKVVDIALSIRNRG